MVSRFSRRMTTFGGFAQETVIRSYGRTANA
jgi:hypothetical protein